MFEVGAAWSLGKEIYPIVGPEIGLQELPGPLSSLPCIEIDSSDAPSRIAELIQQLSEDFGVSLKPGGKAQGNLLEFVGS